MLTDEILELLKNRQWHDLREVTEILNQPEKTIEEVLNFYEKFDFIQLDRTRKKVIIDPKIRELFLQVTL